MTDKLRERAEKWIKENPISASMYGSSKNYWCAAYIAGAKSRDEEIEPYEHGFIIKGKRYLDHELVERDMWMADDGLRKAEVEAILKKYNLDASGVEPRYLDMKEENARLRAALEGVHTAWNEDRSLTNAMFFARQALNPGEEK